MKVALSSDAPLILKRILPLVLLHPSTCYFSVSSVKFSTMFSSSMFVFHWVRAWFLYFDKSLTVAELLIDNPISIPSCSLP